jgi:HK97 family phage major capsid protein
MFETLKHERTHALSIAEGITATVEKENRQLTADETKRFDAAMGDVKKLNERISYLQKNNTLATMFNQHGPCIFMDAGRAKPIETSNGAEVPPADMAGFKVALGDWMRGRVSALDTRVYQGDGAGGESIGFTVPTSVLPYLPTYFNLDSFALAGARQIFTNDTVPLVLPVIGAGAAYAKYNEGAAPTDSAPFAATSVVRHAD